MRLLKSPPALMQAEASEWRPRGASEVDGPELIITYDAGYEELPGPIQAAAALIAAALSCLFYYTPVLNTIPSGFVIILCAVIAAGVMAIAAPLPVKSEVAAHG